MGLLRKLIREITKPSRIAYNGMVGERKVDTKLNPLLFGKVNHKQINNLIIVDEHGKSHQIDHIEIRENGIFCIETKNYSGWIFGSESQEKWAQCLNKEKHQFYNPIKQNKSHIYYLNKALGNKYKINSVIVFTQNNADRIDVDYVVNLADLKGYLKYFNDGTYYAPYEIDEIYEEILSLNTRMSNQQHVRNIKETQQGIKEGICPRCGGRLVKKSGKYGSFIGCSNYPHCKFTMKDE